MALATSLSESPKVAAVNYPGLATHPDHGHASDLLTGFGGMLSFRLAGGVEAAEEFLAALTVPAVAPSLGGVETLITRPAVTSHAGMSPEDRTTAGITDDLLRLSVGIEDVEDLRADFANALDKI